MMAGKPEQPDEAESSVSVALERGLLRQPLDAAAFERVRQSVHAEFVAQHGSVSRRRWSPLWIASMAAALAGVTVLVVLMLSPVREGMPIGQVVRIQNGDLKTSTSVFSHHTVAAGETVGIGQRVTSSGTALIALARGGALRVAPGAVFEGTDAREVVLHSGRVFLDFRHGAGAFVVRTSAGTIEHVGTQFEVSANDGETRIRVREGSVRMTTLADVQLVDAGTEVLVTEAGAVTRRSVSTYGPDWAWVEAIAPEFDIENRELIDVLSWVARETGRRIEFADDRARQVASHTLLHGSVHGLSPLQALDRVLSTTTLRFEVHDDVIRVSSQR